MANIFKNIFGENNETEYDRYLEKHNNSREDLIKLLSENKIIEINLMKMQKSCLKIFIASYVRWRIFPIRVIH